MDMQRLLEEVADDVRPLLGTGKVADYIPALARVPANQFGMAVACLDGQNACVGDAEVPFSIQSISKVFTLALVLRSHGPLVWDRVGREPSGTPFNSIVQLEHEAGVPRNPLINAGAIVVTDHMIGGSTSDQAIDGLLRFMRDRSSNEDVYIDLEVAQSESDSGSRNRSLAYFMSSFSNLRNPVESVLSAYFRQCALSLSCQQLAHAGLFLANNGRDPLGDNPVLSPEQCRRINAVMMTCGHYDGSGDFAFRVGLPGKSGVGGGILVIVPGQAAIAVWSPRLNRSGTSWTGAQALERFAARTGWSVFG